MSLRVLVALAKREWLEHMTSMRSVAVLALAIVLSPLSVFMGVRDYQSRVRDHNWLVQEREALVEGRAGQAVRGLLSPARGDENSLTVLRVIRAPQPLSILSQGLDGSIPRYWDFSRVGAEEGPSASTDLSLADTYPRFDFEFLARVVFGLLAVLIGFDAIGSEREAGTLRSALSNPVSRFKFLSAKFLGGALWLIGGFAFALILVSVTASWLLSGFWTEVLLRKLGWMALLWLVYLLFMYTTALLISTVAATRKTALLFAVMTWFLLTFAIAPLGALLGRISYPAPSPLEIKTEKERIARELEETAAAEMGLIYREVTGAPSDFASATLFTAHEEQLLRQLRPVVDEMVVRRKTEMERLSRRRRSMIERARRVAIVASALSPAALASDATSDLAGTGNRAFDAWLQAIDDHCERLNQSLFDNPPQVKLSVDQGRASMWPYLRTPPPVDSLPRFDPPALTSKVMLWRHSFSIGLLCMYLFASLVALFAAFRRSDIR